MANVTYSSAEVAISWGPIPFESLGQDTFVTVSENTPSTTNKVGADGRLSTSISPDETGSVQIILQDVGVTSKILSGIYGAQKQRLIPGVSLIRLPMVISDPAGTLLAFFNGAHIMSIEDFSLSKESSDRAFNFHIEQLIYTGAPSGLATGIADIQRNIGDFITGNT